MFINKNGLTLIFILILTTTYAQEKINQFDAQGNRHGKWVKTFEGTDQKRYEGNFEHGKEVGTFKFYKPKSKTQPVATKTYTKENDSVEVKFFTKKGKLVSQGMLIDKKREGTWQYYHKSTNNLMMIENYKHDMLNGVKTIYFPNGKITEKQVYKDGVLNGENFIYGEKGQLIQYYNYKNGVLNGRSKTYDAAGNLTSEGSYKKGLRDGDWKFYENGKLKEKKHYPILRPSLKGKQHKPD